MMCHRLAHKQEIMLYIGPVINFLIFNKKSERNGYEILFDFQLIYFLIFNKKSERNGYEILFDFQFSFKNIKDPDDK